MIAAPAIVRATSLMKVKSLILPGDEDWVDVEVDVPADLYAQLAAITRRAFVPRLFVQVWSESPLLSSLQLDNSVKLIT